MQTESPVEITTLGGGCFWCVEAVLQDLKGVKSIVSGYAGGKIANPTYREICSGTTGHAEVVQVTFDPTEISFADILEVFFATHDPTTLNRQGNDVGTQYRSVIFYHSDAQKQIAEQTIQTSAKALWGSGIVTEIAPLPVFYPAETYHQNYYNNNPNQPYCSFVVGPKVKKVREKFREKLKN
jgi:peptide-methionine (S)-S-oxide reductase